MCTVECLDSPRLVSSFSIKRPHFTSSVLQYVRFSSPVSQYERWDLMRITSSCFFCFILARLTDLHWCYIFACTGQSLETSEQKVRMLSQNPNEAPNLTWICDCCLISHEYLKIWRRSLTWNEYKMYFLWPQCHRTPLNTLYLNLYSPSWLTLALFSPFAVISPGGRGQSCFSFSTTLLPLPLCSVFIMTDSFPCLFMWLYLCFSIIPFSFSFLYNISFKLPILIRTINVLIKLEGGWRQST